MADLRAVLSHNAVLDGVQPPLTVTGGAITHSLGEWLRQVLGVCPAVGGDAISWAGRGSTYSIIVCPGRVILTAMRGDLVVATDSYELADPQFPNNLQGRLLRLHGR